MSFTPHTANDIDLMLKEIGINTINQLFDEIPADLVCADLNVPEGISELELARLMNERAPAVHLGKNFLGAGAYEHYIPAAVWEITGRGEFLTAYTPYQAEASQGSLQVIYEYQSMMSQLMALDVSNASLYDGATALAEAILMAIRLKKNEATRVLLPASVHPLYRRVLESILSSQHIELDIVPLSLATGTIDIAELIQSDLKGVAALVIPQPNFFGNLEDVDTLANWAHDQHILSIALVNPMSCALLKAPGNWGEHGVDIACGEGQPLGAPLASGGPYFGFMCCKMEHIRQMPGRIVGCTEDAAGRKGYTLTLQTREQHIRRAKATSNICTNQGLLVTAATIYLSLMGAEGLRRAALASHQNARRLLQHCLELKGVSARFNNPFFHEFVLQLPMPASEVIKHMAAEGYQAGLDLSTFYPELSNCLLVCATETKTEQDLINYSQALRKAVK
ncbi:MAG TPA: aminomethyl-transferring glycine dehydrogenase subunit GcvPA [Coxiellaceae bacterium]|nr:aminomethyl-transferring glycine dehydrogenase subunit GcvPA [Coxiellaceae bacterium]